MRLISFLTLVIITTGLVAGCATQQDTPQQAAVEAQAQSEYQQNEEERVQ